MNQADALIDQLILQNVTTFCIAPGSRSAPLVLAVHRHTRAKKIIHFDERGLAFFALGIGKATKSPAAMITTSGTAAANLLPAIMEAHYSHTPLIIITADRPEEMKLCGANQTTDQVKLFSSFVRFEMNLFPDIDAPFLRSIVSQAVFHAADGPVHLNCPFREPLYCKNGEKSIGKPVSFVQHQITAAAQKVTAKKGIILLGNDLIDPKPAIHLAQKIQWPIFADILSNARKSPSFEQICHFDALLEKKLFQPDFILHLGGSFVSKQILHFAKDIEKMHVSPFSDLQDPDRNVSIRVRSDLSSFCKNFQAGSDPTWFSLWKEADEAIESTLEKIFQSHFTELHAAKNLPEGHPLFLGNSMPIRDADRFFFPKRCPSLFANRGVSGIDGNIATMAGIAEGLQTPVVGFIGDQTALHDLNSLPLLQRQNCLLIISNNKGGNIFDLLDSAKEPCLDTCFRAMHSWSFEDAAHMFHIPYQKRQDSLENLPSSGIVELITDRMENLSFRKYMKKEIDSCLETLLKPNVSQFS